MASLQVIETKKETIVDGDEWELYAARKALVALDFTQSAGQWKREKPLHPITFQQIKEQVNNALDPVIKTCCGICRKPGHWRTTCPTIAQEKKEEQQDILKDSRYKRFRLKQCMCGPPHYPSICLVCRYACCEQAYQPVAYIPHFTCIEHGVSRHVEALDDL
jgi:hypothetical protein